jgi:hypothetical protein
VYPDGAASTGETLFLSLVRSARFSVDYRFRSASPHDVRGTAALDARIVSATGWTRVIALAPATPFTGDRATVGGTVRLDTLARLLERVEATTGVTNTTYRLELRPRVRVTGAVAGASLAETFEPVVSFALDHLQVRPPLDQPVGAGPAPGDTLEPTESSSLSTTRVQQRTIELGPLEVGVEAVRRGASIAAALSLLVCAGGLLLGRRGTRDEATLISRRYGARLASATRSDDNVVEFDKIETLVRFADRYDRLIVRERREHGDAYWFAEDGLYYVYLAEGSAAAAAAQTEVGAPRLRRVV